MPRKHAHESYDCGQPYSCSVEATLDVIGGKWKGVILYHLAETRRFNELQRLIPGVNRRMLTLQLRELERDGLVYREVPPKVEYSLSEFGQTLSPLILQMRDWGATYVARLQAEVNVDEPVTSLTE